jgi:succinate dehydrogenase / fumarate reductase cytochrome b subunit
LELRNSIDGGRGLYDTFVQLMDFITGIFKTSLGRKYLMAITGAGLFGFVVMHMLGNLLVFAGPAAINEYAAKLQALGPLLWVARIGLLGMVGLHIWSAIKLTSENREARTVEYDAAAEPVDAHRRGDIVAKFAARTMIFSGLIIAAFAFYHLAHFTWKVPQINGAGTEDFELYYVADDFTTPLAEGKEGKDHADVFKMIVTGFQVPAVSVFYVVAVGLLCFHLSHGLSAMFQSLGVKNKNIAPWMDGFAVGASALIFLGYISIPVSVLVGFIKIG